MNIKGWSIVVGVALGALGIAYYEGGRATRLDLRHQAREDSLKHNAEALRLSAKLLDAQHRATVAEAARDSIARVRYADARRKVRIVSDTQVVVLVRHDSAGTAVVDSVGSTWTVPKEIVAVIANADGVVAQSQITQRAQAAENATLYRRDTLHVEGEQLRDRELAETKPQRCGRRCGFVAGVSVALAATHPKDVLAAARWVIRLVR